MTLDNRTEFNENIPRIQGDGVREAGADKIQPLMTGQEWYDRFITELNKYHPDKINWEKCIAAAKRATTRGENA